MNLVILKASDPHAHVRPAGYNPYSAGVDLAGDVVNHPNSVKEHGLKLAHYNDILDPNGKILPFVPFYADRYKVGRIPLANGTSMYGQGGPDYPVVAKKGYVWANLADGEPGNQVHGKAGSKGAETYRQLSLLHPHGYVGAVYLGKDTASLGNIHFLQLLKHHLEHKAHQNESGVMDFIRTLKHQNGSNSDKYKDIDDFIKTLSPLSTTARKNYLEPIVTSLGVGKDAKSIRDFLDLPGALYHFNDYNHVPRGHIVRLIRVPHNAGIARIHSSEGGHDVYPWHLEGHDIGMLHRSVNLHDVGFNSDSGDPAYLKNGVSYIKGSKGKGGGMVSDVFGMHNAQQTGINLHGADTGDFVQRSITIVPTLDISKSHGYNEVEVNKMYPKPDDRTYALFMDRLQKDVDPTPEEALHDRYMTQSQNPEVQAKIAQRVARSLPK